MQSRTGNHLHAFVAVIRCSWWPPTKVRHSLALRMVAGITWHPTKEILGERLRRGCILRLIQEIRLVFDHKGHMVGPCPAR